MNRLAVPENPDTGNISDKAELGSPVMIVASANNPGKAEYETISLSGKQIVLMPRINSFGTTFGLSDELAPGEYQFADCGTGTKDELEAAGSLTGKIALVQRTAEAPSPAKRSHGISRLRSAPIPHGASSSRLISGRISWASAAPCAPQPMMHPTAPCPAPRCPRPIWPDARRSSANI